MTLVIAERLNNRVSLSSDSRIGFGPLGRIDYGIKVFTVPVNIFSPTSSETNVTNLDYNYKLGLAVVGSAVTAYTVKESVYEILQNLQYIPGYTELSMDSIAELVFKVFKKTTIDLGEILEERGLCDIILAGYCPTQNKIRIFKFWCDIVNNQTIPDYDEILKVNGMEFFGSGEDEANLVYNDNKNFTPLHIIRKVIKDGKVNSVGGGLQYGEFVINNFKIYGVTDYETYPDGSFKEFLYTLRGINLYKDEFERGDDGFHIAYTFKTPFEKEIQDKLIKDIGED